MWYFSFQLNIREDEVIRLNNKVKQLQQEIRDLNSQVENDNQKVWHCYLEKAETENTLLQEYIYGFYNKWKVFFSRISLEFISGNDLYGRLYLFVWWLIFLKKKIPNLVEIRVLPSTYMYMCRNALVKKNGYSRKFWKLRQNYCLLKIKSFN